MATVPVTKDAKIQPEECPICNDVRSDIYFLPCAHKLCLDCLKKLCRNESNGEMVTCPLCRRMFALSSFGCPVAVETCVQSVVTGCTANYKESAKLAKTGKCNCMAHPEKDLIVYCFQCREPCCLICIIDHHQHHKIGEIDVACEKLRLELKNHSLHLNAKLLKYKDVARQIEVNQAKCASYFETMQGHILETIDRLKETATCHADELHQHLASLKGDKFLEYGYARSKNEKRIVELETFLEKCDATTRDGTVFDVVHEFEAMNETATRLESISFVNTVDDVECLFEPTNIESYLPDARRNMIGNVYRTKEDYIRCCRGSAVLQEEKLNRRTKCAVAGCAENYQLKPNQSEQVIEAENDVLRLSSTRGSRVFTLPLILTVIIASLASLQGVVRLYNEDNKHDTFEDELFQKASLLRQLRNNMTLYAASTGTLITKIVLDVDVTAMTSLNGIMFVAGPADQKGEQTRINAYDMLSYALTESFLIDYRITDMTSSPQCNCLYFACFKERNIVRASPRAINSSSTEWSWLRWSVPDEPFSVSVNLIGNVLVTFHDSARVGEYTSAGELLREITLPSNISSPKQVIELDTDKFVVVDDHKQVCIVDAGGHLLHHTPPELLSYVQHIAVNGFIFVADFPNERVMLLTSSLSFVRYVLSGISPTKLFFVDDNNLVVLTRERSPSFKHIAQVFSLI